MHIFEHNDWLALTFASLMGFSILVYVILDGYDLGVGILMSRATEEERDKMIASIGPFWDANETWLVLGVGILLIAFPIAHGIILSSLYIPTAFMLYGLILRGVSFDFRAKAKYKHKKFWDRAFIAGSIISSMSQGYMLGNYILGFDNNFSSILFGLLAGVCLVAGYSFVGASWLIMKTENDLQKKAIKWARITLVGTAIGIVLVSLATPFISQRIFDKWFSLPNFFLLIPIPLISFTIIVGLELILKEMPMENDKYCYLPFVGSVIIFMLGFFGLAYSFFPYIVPDKLTIWEAASAPESLKVILFGVLLVLPFIIAYTVFAYKVFWGKVRDLRYY